MPLRRKGRFFVEGKGALVESSLIQAVAWNNFAAENKNNHAI
jgi:hypothetical protein